MAEGGRAWFGTLRVKTTIIAVVVVGVAFALGALAIVIYLRISLERSVRTAADLRARDVAANISDGGPSELSLGDDDDSFVQVLDASGNVIASSPKVAGEGPVADIAPGESTKVTTIEHEENDPFVVIARSAVASGVRYKVLVGRNLDLVEESLATLGRTFLIGLPLLLAVVALTTYFLIGRALRVVESIRRRVAEISTSQLDRRVPEPNTADEIGRLARTMNAMLARLEDEQKRQRRFVSDASHELRSPVTTIRNQAEVALAHPDATQVEDLARDVLAEDLRLERLVDDLLVLARSDENGRAEALRPIDMDDIVLEEAERARANRNVTMDVSGVSGGRVMGDSTRIRRMVRNLVDNATRHATSRVAIGLQEIQGEVVLFVDDDGPGVPADKRDEVFRRFTRLEGARDRDSGGAGLGLAIVRATAVALGGDALVADSPLGGARFEVRLPAAE